MTVTLDLEPVDNAIHDLLAAAARGRNVSSGDVDQAMAAHAARRRIDLQVDDRRVTLRTAVERALDGIANARRLGGDALAIVNRAVDQIAELVSEWIPPHDTIEPRALAARIPRR